MTLNKHIPYLIIIVILLILINRQCEKEPKTITETVIKTVIVKDTINKTIIKEVPKTVYVERIKTIKGKDSIIYVDKPSDTSITANQFDATLKANEATAKLKITTTGQLLDVFGTIEYPKTETTNTTIINRDMSGLFAFIQSDIQFNQPSIGALYQFKNKAFVSGSVSKLGLQVGVGIKIY